MRIELRQVVRRFAEVAAVAGVSLEVRDGELFTLLGPSGCGKTTLLRLIAGFASPDAGEIWFGDRRVDRLPPHARNIGMVFQNYALWPHMTVRANVTYGLRLRKLAGPEIESRLAAGLRKVNLSGLEARYPGQLSGGQQQRVALARALVLNPDILLLDEPLSNLDAKIRVQVRGEIRTLQRELGITTIYVTHDQEEALSLSDRVAVMREGRVLQLASPKELYERPVNRFVADFVGTNNFLAGTCQGVERDALVVDTALGVVRARRHDGLAPGARCVLAVRPENIALRRDLAPLAAAPNGNAFRGTIALSSYLGNTLRYDVDLGGGIRVKLDVRDPWHHDLLPAGQPVEVSFPASAALALPDE